MKTKNTQIRLTALFALILVMAISYAANAQSTVKRDVNGNFKTVSAQEAAHDSTTTFTFTNSRGDVRPVYRGKRGGYYVCRVSKRSGKFYRKYLKTED